LNGSDRERLSVSLIDVGEGRDAEFLMVTSELATLLARKHYGRTDVVRDEGAPRRFYVVRHWMDAAAAARCHADAYAQAVMRRLAAVGRVVHVVNGVHAHDPLRLTLDERRFRVEPDRRAGFDRRVADVGWPDGERRSGAERRLGPRRLREHGVDTDLVAAARRAREHAEARYSQFKVGAAIEAGDGSVITGCNIENATYGLTICAERVAIFKALSEGHRQFTRIAVVADSEAPTPPCGACRQILWEFAGNIEVRLANLTHDTGTHQLRDLLPVPFDARLL
jgi:cytidine deaminase